MKNKFIRLTIDEFPKWLADLEVSKSFKFIQLHHTEEPAYKDFGGDNHIELCWDMEEAHLRRGFGGIAQNFTTFPDGDIVVCRSLEDKTIGIKGANDFAVNIENLGNFDFDHLSEQHKNTIIEITQLLCHKFSIALDQECILYHHWFDRTTGERIPFGKAGHTKTCPGRNFFGGNTFDDFKTNLLPLLQKTYSQG